MLECSEQQKRPKLEPLQCPSALKRDRWTNPGPCTGEMAFIKGAKSDPPTPGSESSKGKATKPSNSWPSLGGVLMGGGVRGALRGAGMVPLICMWLWVSSGCVKIHRALLTLEHFPVRLLHTEVERGVGVGRSRGGASPCVPRGSVPLDRCQFRGYVNIRTPRF